MTRPRVVITGIGIVSALGPTRESTWNRMVEGACGIGPITTFATDGYRSRVGAEVPTDSIDACFSALERRRWSRSDRFGVIAAAEAIEDADLLSGDCDRTRIGVLLGAGTADLLRNERFYQTMLASGIARTRPSDAWNHFSITPVDVIAARFGLEGLRSCVVAACSSSTIAIGQAADAVRSGRVDAALAGGTDALCQLTFSGFNALKLMDPNACRPFDRGRAGMSIGEGAAILVLETLERARGRGAFVYAELAGYGLSCEAFHPTAPEPDGRAVSTWSAAPSAMRASMRARSTTSAHMARRRRRTIVPRPAGSHVRSARGRGTFPSPRSSR